LKAVKFQKPASEWIWQLQHATRALNREEAAYALGTMPGPETIAALRVAGTGDAFHGVRVEAANALGRIPRTGEALLGILADKNSEVRSAAAAGLGNLKKSDLESNPGLVDRLLEAARTDASFEVRRSALRSIGKLKPPKALELVKPFLEVDGLRDAVPDALASLGDDAALPIVLELSNDHDDRVRGSALHALSSLGKGKQPVTDRLIEALHETDEKGDRRTAVFALRDRRETSAVSELQNLAANDPMPDIARAAKSAVEAINAPARSTAPTASSGDIVALQKRLTELEKENGELKARFDRIEKDEKK
jgi:HEAT repeat protein